ncbi:redox-regulated ATPase YchF [Candidatus Woesearchaeota archaeon]|nr:redox-regulated ATPase YchF [Candidatus Woesearchaeota archaeon]
MLVGIVGKPNCGKSTFFKALSLADVEIANYPFATIKPNSGVGYVKIDCVDTEFNVQCNPREGFCVNHKRFVPVQLIDVAGLVPGAYEGKGMGNQFLDDLRQADVLIHIIDGSGSTNEKGESVQRGSYDPAEDIKFLETELDMWYLGIFKKVWDRFSRTVRQEHADSVKAIAKQFSGLMVDEDLVKAGFSALGLDTDISKWTEDQLKQFVSFLRKKTKPMVIACNKIDVAGAAENLARLKKEFPDHMIVGCSAESELALKEANKKELIEYVPGDNTFKIPDNSTLNDNQKNALEFIRDNVLVKFGSSGVQTVLNCAVFDLLRYIAIFPGGVGKLQDKDGNYIPDCYLMPPNSTALDFAYRLHTDFGDNFIRAVDVKTRMSVGRDHILKHRDVIEIMSNK